MKVLILANSPSGVYDFRGDLISELKTPGSFLNNAILDEEADIYIAIPNGDKFKELEKMGYKCVETQMDRRGINPIIDLKLIIKYYRLVQNIDPDLIITYTIKPNIYGGIVSRLFKKKYVINITGLGTAFERGGILTSVVIILYKFACKKANTVFFENQGNCNLFLDKGIILQEQSCVLNGAGVNLEKFKFYEYPQSEIIKFLFMGRVMKEKGIDELFYACEKLYKDGVKFELHVLGYYEENYEEIIDKYVSDGWLYYHGFQSDVRPFIQECSCFVLPSWHEGMANTNLESAASGRPIITSDIHGCKEAVDDGKSGFVVECRNVEALYRTMKYFCELTYEERKMMGIAGRKHMEKVFDKKKVVEKTIIEMYKE